MYIKQSDLLRGLDKKFLIHFFEASIKETHSAGSILFREGDSSDYFFILLKGSIRLELGKLGRTTYLVNHAGEAFGWSALVGRDVYSASAICLKDTMIMKFKNKHIREITASDSFNGMKFYKRLARMLGNRLIHSYHVESETIPDNLMYSFGSGQEIKSYAAL